MYKLENIYKSYDKEKTFVLNNLSFEIEDGDFIAITGASGSGKSTLLNILATLDKPTSGHYLQNGKNLVKLTLNQLAKFRNENIGVVFQEYNLIPEYTVKENVMLPLLFSKHKDNKNNYEHIVKSLGIDHLADKSSNLLSGGEQQRVAFARAIINNPNMILADEPTGNLDIENAGQLFKIVKKLNNDGKTIVVVTHNLELAEKFTKIYNLEFGRLVRIK